MSCGPNLNPHTKKDDALQCEPFGLNPAGSSRNFNQDWPLCVFGARDRVWVVAGWLGRLIM